MPPLMRTRMRIPLANSSWAKTPVRTGGLDIGTRLRNVLRPADPDTVKLGVGRQPGSVWNCLSVCDAAPGTRTSFEPIIAVGLLVLPSAAVTWLATATWLLSADATTDEYDIAKRTAVLMQSASALIPQWTTRRKQTNQTPFASLIRAPVLVHPCPGIVV